MDHGQSVEGLNAFDNGDYIRALNLLVPLAEKGNAQAQCHIASMYHLGLGVEADGLKAVDWYLKAAEQKSTTENISGLAYHNLATLYVTGMPGIAADKELALLYRREAEILGVDLWRKD